MSGPLRHQVGETHHRIERRANFMAGIGQKFAGGTGCVLCDLAQFIEAQVVCCEHRAATFLLPEDHVEKHSGDQGAEGGQHCGQTGDSPRAADNIIAVGLR